MADKRLRKLTIDDETMEIPNQVTLYKANNTTNTCPTAWATVKGASITLDKKGIYLIQATVGFTASTQTGQTTHSVRIMHSAGGAALSQNKTVDAEPYSVERTLTTYAKLLNDTPVEVYVDFMSARPLSGNIPTGIKALRILSEYDDGN